jgi:beta-glucanase (GH16 family)
MADRRVEALAVLALAPILVASFAGCGQPSPRLTAPSSPTVQPSPTAQPSPTSQPTDVTAPSPTAGTPSPYTFDDEFDDTTLGPVWQRHFRCCGNLAGFDPSLTTVAGGFLSISVAHRPAGWYSDLVDTKATWTQQYGLFEARIEIPKGPGLWPAFWSYVAGGGRQAEIDTMEVCGSGTGGGSVLHTSVHWSGRGLATHATRAVDLSRAFHVYGVDWRPDQMTFLLDGRPVWTFRDARHIPSAPMPLILDLGVGGDFCGPPDATTPNGATMLVDWIRVSP